MGKAVLVSNRQTIYDDVPEVRYHYPRQYARRVEQAKGNWIVYYESGSNGGRQVYFAAAQIAEIVPDPTRPDHYYAYVKNFISFPNPVPWRHDLGYWEVAFGNDLQRPNSGIAQNAVRIISDREYEAIVSAGLANMLAGDAIAPSDNAIGFGEAAEPFHRPIIERLVHEPLRSKAFAECVRLAYDSACAATGLKLVNGGGRCEIEAAHIRPVGDGHGGPDSVRNGLALSRTVHWLFDRGLISMQDDGRILFASHRRFPEIERVRGLLHREYMRLPDDPALRPHPQFLEYHRDKIHAPKAR
jgi:putative restriction endonuclease